MSGGHFSYEQYKISQIAEDVDQLIRNNGKDEKDEWGYTKHSHFTDETIEEFKKGLHYLRLAHIYAQRIDWLVSGDDGEDSFHRRLQAEIDKLTNNPI